MPESDAPNTGFFPSLPGGSPDLAYAAYLRGELDPRPRKPRKLRPHNHARAWLLAQRLPVPERDIRARYEADAPPFSWKTLLREKEKLGVLSKREGGTHGAWVWQAPLGFSPYRTRYASPAERQAARNARRRARTARRKTPDPDVGGWLHRYLPARGLAYDVAVARAARYVTRAVCERRGTTAREVVEEEIARARRRKLLGTRTENGTRILYPRRDNGRTVGINGPKPLKARQAPSFRPETFVDGYDLWVAVQKALGRPLPKGWKKPPKQPREPGKGGHRDA